MLFYLILSLTALASEPDNFTARLAAPELGNFLDDSMNAALEKAAAATRDCKKQNLHNQIILDLGGFKASLIEKMPYQAKVNEDTGAAIVVKDLPTRDSIYRDSNKLPGLKFGPLEAGGCCAPTFKYKGTHLAADKLGHFLHSGYEMFYFANLKGDKEFEDASKTTSFWNNVVRKLAERKFQTTEKGERAVIALSKYQEASIWGLTNTGVYSYGDIVANLEGYRFWQQLTDGPNPYFTCQDGQWKLARKFSWANYVNSGWDEGINCSEYYSDRMSQEVKTLIKESLFKQGFKTSTCPIEAKKCQELLSLYSGDALGAVSPACSNGSTNESIVEQGQAKGKDAL